MYYYYYSTKPLLAYSSLSHCLHTFVSGDRYHGRSDGQFRGLLRQKYCFREQLAKKEMPEKLCEELKMLFDLFSGRCWSSTMENFPRSKKAYKF